MSAALCESEVKVKDEVETLILNKRKVSMLRFCTLRALLTGILLTLFLHKQPSLMKILSSKAHG